MIFCDKDGKIYIIFLNHVAAYSIIVAIGKNYLTVKHKRVTRERALQRHKRGFFSSVGKAFSAVGDAVGGFVSGAVDNVVGSAVKFVGGLLGGGGGSRYWSIVNPVKIIG